MIIVLKILFAYLLADLISGIYHVLTDRGWNIPKQVMLFQQHHVTRSLEFDLSPFLFASPLFILAYWWQPVFCIALAISCGFIQVTHYYTHFPAPLPIRLLQKAHLIMGPEEHEVHHSNFDLNFCILSGWNNIWFNQLIRFIDFLNKGWNR